MGWTGKVVGALIGLVAGPVGAAVGAVIGHGYDLSQQKAKAEPRRLPDDSDPAAIGEALFRTAFAVMGHLAKADGRVSEREIDAARHVMRLMQLQPADVQRAIDEFTRGKQPDYPAEAELARLRALCGPRHDLLRFFVEIQMRAALAGNDLQGPVRARLHAIAGGLGFGALELASQEAALRLQQGRTWSGGSAGARHGSGPGAGHGGSGAAAAASQRLRTAYEILGVAATASDDEVKKAYRRQMNENHPDKLIARGLPESMQELAKEKTQRIREAYETICEHRGIR
ncbi:MAG: co-chaperone DjlA [Steroidobacteraceae bacterium]|jgi:DnaJ like chaperone protein|nr:co-chaperone DjlA [Steroidobacteraceae bacterium]